MNEAVTEAGIVNEGDYQGLGGIGVAVLARLQVIADIEDEAGAVDKTLWIKGVGTGVLGRVRRGVGPGGVAVHGEERNLAGWRCILR